MINDNNLGTCEKCGNKHTSLNNDNFCKECILHPYKECKIINCGNRAKWWYLGNDNEPIYLCSDHIPVNGGDDFELGECEED